MSDSKPPEKVRRKRSTVTKPRPSANRTTPASSKKRTARDEGRPRTASGVPAYDASVEARLTASASAPPLPARRLQRMPKSHTLSINLPGRSATDLGVKSPKSPRSPLAQDATGPATRAAQTHEYAEGYDVYLQSPITTLPTPPSPHSPKLKNSKGIFSNIKATKSTPKISRPEMVYPDSGEPNMPPDASAKLYTHRKAHGSTPELGLQNEDILPSADGVTPLEADDEHANSPAYKSSSTPYMNTTSSKEKDRKPSERRNIFRLGRKGSIQTDDLPRGVDLRSANSYKSLKSNQDNSVPQTAPLGGDRGFRDMMNSTLRNRSADRSHHGGNDSSDDNTSTTTAPTTTNTLYPPQPRRIVRTHDKPAEDRSFFSSHFGKAADGIGRAGKALAKLGRSGSSHEKEPPPSALSKEPYVPQVIVLPLIQQTRISRISKRLEDCRDKTEFWMPALPWRCIDFLNANGVTAEGIYRVPGSTRDVASWERRFDTELDIDLLHPDTPIYDINTIASMLKNWLRRLPDDIIPKSVQTSVTEIVTERYGDPLPKYAPQELKDALSSLPPFNYYLLFAITCHISLLNAHPETTKMSFQNLTICLQPCLKVSSTFFQWLVEDWRNCWQGCWTEKEYLEREYEWLEEQDRRGNGVPHPPGSSSGRQQQSRAATAGTGNSSASNSFSGPTPNTSYIPSGVSRDVRPKTGLKEAKTNAKNGSIVQEDSRSSPRPTQHYEKFPTTSSTISQPSTTNQTTPLQTFSPARTPATSAPEDPSTYLSTNNDPNRPATSHAPMFTAFDPAQAMHATTAGPSSMTSTPTEGLAAEPGRERALSSSGSGSVGTANGSAESTILTQAQNNERRVLAAATEAEAAKRSRRSEARKKAGSISNVRSKEGVVREIEITRKGSSSGRTRTATVSSAMTASPVKKEKEKKEKEITSSAFSPSKRDKKEKRAEKEREKEKEKEKEGDVFHDAPTSPVRLAAKDAAESDQAPRKMSDGPPQLAPMKLLEPMEGLGL